MENSEKRGIQNISVYSIWNLVHSGFGWDLWIGEGEIDTQWLRITTGMILFSLKTRYMKNKRKIHNRYTPSERGENLHELFHTESDAPFQKHTS